MEHLFILLFIYCRWELSIQNPVVSHQLLWRQIGRDSISNHQPHDCLLNWLFRLRSKKTSKLRVTGLYAGNSRVTGKFPTQMGSNAENVSIWWRHHALQQQYMNVMVSQITSHLSDCSAVFSVVLHIDTTNIIEIDICPPLLISILWYPSHRYITISCFSGFAQSILQKNTANTIWLARMIIPILNTISSTLNPVVIITWSPHFSNMLGVMPFARWIFTKNSTNLASN